MILSDFRIFKHKKAQGINYLTIMIFLFTFGFLSILGYLFLSNFVTQFSTTDQYSIEVEEVGDKFLSGLRLFDKILVTMMVILIIGLGITTYKLAAPPAFFLVTFVTGGIYGFISYFFNYIFAQMVSDSIFTSTLLYFPGTILLCTNLHWVMLVSIIVGSITLYAKKPRGQFLA